MIDIRLIEKSVLTDPEAAQFKHEARHWIYSDPETRGTVECYIHPDGRILIASVKPSRT